MPSGVYKRTKKHIEQCRKAMLGRKLSPEWKAKISKKMKELTNTLDHKRKVSKHFKKLWKNPKHRKYISELCSKYVGPLSSQWKGGIHLEPYPFGWQKQLKDRVRVRDNFKCQMCGVPELELNYTLSVHHIDYVKKNLELSNLICLCKKCHGKTNANREQWTKKFSQMLHAEEGTRSIISS